MSTTFWDRLWRSAGIQFVILLIIAYLIYGDQPKVGSSPDTLVSFYDGNRMRIVIATFLVGMRSCTFSGSRRRSEARCVMQAKTVGGRP